MEVQHKTETIRLGPRQRRFLLALLLLEPGRPVGFDRLVRLMWGADPPPTARGAIQVHVSHLRKELGCSTASTAARIVTSAAGYAVQVDSAAVDVHQFRRLVAEARTAFDLRAVQLYRSALALWRGDPLADVASAELTAVLCGGLLETRLLAVEECFERELRLGRHAVIVPELSDEAAAHPERARLIGQLMIALYRGGREGEALEVYRRACSWHAEELGLDPAPELERLHSGILNHDSALCGHDFVDGRSAPRSESVSARVGS